MKREHEVSRRLDRAESLVSIPLVEALARLAPVVARGHLLLQHLGHEEGLEVMEGRGEDGDGGGVRTKRSVNEGSVVNSAHTNTHM